MSILKQVKKKERRQVKPVQAKLDVELLEKVKSEIKKDGITLTELIDASFKTYLKEKKAA